MSRYDTELEVMAEGLHPRDIVWLEKRVKELESKITEDRRIMALLEAKLTAAEGDASGG